ncbi:MAG: hypothetical protein WHS83_10225, partial [Chloroflexus sp.]|uniref:hypothetical protein n=1 Tax=Chloroflexus sp. TaxID=1904827 RepID=UPI00309F2417
TQPAPTGTQPAPTGTQPAPTGAQPAPTGAQPAPIHLPVHIAIRGKRQGYGARVHPGSRAMHY